MFAHVSRLEMASTTKLDESGKYTYSQCNLKNDLIPKRSFVMLEICHIF